MARLGSYPLDTNLSDGDYLLGNDVDDTGGIATKRFSLEDIKEFVNIGVDVLQSSPGGYIPIVTDNGEGLKASQIVQELGLRQDAAVAFVTDPTDSPLYLNGQILPNGILADGTNGTIIEIWDYRQPFEIASFNGRSFSMVVSGGIHTGIIGAMTGEPETILRGGVENTAVFRFAVTITSDMDVITENWQSFTVGSAEVGDSLQRLTLLISADVEIENLALGLGLTVGGEAIFNAGATVAGEFVSAGTVTLNNDLHVEGDVFIDGTSGGILFGQVPEDTDPDYVSITVDGDNIAFGGNGMINIPNQTNFSTAGDSNVRIENGIITITNDNGETLTFNGINELISSTGQNIVHVSANPTGSSDGNLLSLQIGNQVFTLPEFTSGVAAALPGLNEELAGPEAEIVLGRFFVGIEQGSGALFQSDPVLTTGATQTVDADATSEGLGGDTGGNAAFITALRVLIDGLDAGQSVFFVSTQHTDAFPAVGVAVPETVVGGLYELLTFEDDSASENTIFFSRLGGGTLNLFTEEVVIASSNTRFPNLRDYDSATDLEFVYLNPTDGSISSNPLDIVGRANGARFEQGGSDVLVTSLEFTGNHNVGNTGGAVTVDVSGRGIESSGHTVSFEAAAFSFYLLSTTTTQQTVTLPSGTAGDSIKVINNGEASNWRIIPNAGQVINSQPVDEEVILDNTDNFELIYNNTTGGSVGWLIL